MRMVVTAVLCLLSSSGCLGGAPLADSGALDQPWGPAHLGICTEAGYVSLFRHGTFPDIVPPPWVAADIRGETGDPARGTGGAELQGPTTGLWHMTVYCQLASRADGNAIGDLWWSYVGIRVEPPAWDDGRAARHFLVGQMSFSDRGLAQDVQATTGRPVANASAGVMDWLEPGGVPALHTSIYDDVHGTFETEGTMRPLYAKENQTTRMWLLDSIGHDPETGNQFVPIPVDFDDGYLDGATVWGVRDGLVTFNHREPTGDLAHAEYMGGFYAATGFARQMTLPDPPAGIVLNRSWAH